jgi:DNA recombination protein RmuC
LDRSGLEKGRDYIVQQSLTSEDNQRFIPDVIVNLPDNKNLIIDSKVSLVAYDQYCGAETDAQKEKFLKEHLSSLNNHIKELSSKEYSKLRGVNSPDFVLCSICKIDYSNCNGRWSALCYPRRW